MILIEEINWLHFTDFSIGISSHIMDPTIPPEKRAIRLKHKEDIIERIEGLFGE